MEIKQLKDNKTKKDYIKLGLEGTMTIYNAVDVKELLTEHMENNTKFQLDLSGITELDTSGVQLLIWFKQMAAAESGDVDVITCSRVAEDIFELYKLTDWLGTEQSANVN